MKNTLRQVFHSPKFVYHGVKVAAGNAHTEAGAAHNFQRFRVFPVNLGEDTDFVAAIFKDTSDDGSSERGVVNISVTRNKQNINAVPVAFFQVSGSHREKKFSHQNCPSLYTIV